jgi:NADPH:quinone reductase-like Zn-dependent oxidoreductase
LERVLRAPSGVRDMMKAVRVHGYGGPEVLVYEDAPRPSPGLGEILVHVRAAGVNPLDCKVRQGTLQPHVLPLIPGWDFSGVVEEGSGDFARSDEVYGRADLGMNGAYAEYLVVRPADMARKPRSIDHVHAAAVPTAGLFAWQALFGPICLDARRTILIHGAATGTGTFAVQLARWRGANVIATSDSEHVAFVRELGAQLVIDEGKRSFEEVVHDVDAVLDLLGGDLLFRSPGVIRPGGVLVSTVTTPPDAPGIRSLMVLPESSSAQLTALSRLIDARVLQVIVSHVLPLASARQAHELIEHEPGEIVLDVAA